MPASYTKLPQADEEHLPHPPVVTALCFRKRHSRLVVVVAFVALFSASAAVSFIVAYRPSHLIPSTSSAPPVEAPSSADVVAPGARPDADAKPDPHGWRPYTPSPSTRASALFVRPDRIEPTRSQRLLSVRCADMWISKGIVCDSLGRRISRAASEGDDGSVDMIWTWVNGSDPALTAIREKAALEKRARARRPMTPLGDVQRHFRDRDELRYSMRSVFANVPHDAIRKLHLFTTTLPATDGPVATLPDGDGAGAEERLAQVPTWLTDGDGPTVAVRHHWEAMKVTEGVLKERGQSADAAGSLAWREQVLPTFNSFAIESQIPNLDDLGDTLVDFNDDFFVLRPLSQSDFSTVLFGPVFRSQTELQVRPMAWPSSSNLRNSLALEGEWPSLSYTDLLLSQRFGTRDRRYLVHVAKVLSVPVAREFAAVWSDEMARTAGVKFRGRKEEVYFLWGATWYHIERHREALLHSFVMLKSDEDLDGVLSPSEQRKMLQSLGATNAKSIPVANPERDAPDAVDRLDEAGIPRPKETEYTWTSMDGYPLVDQTGQPFKSWPDYRATSPTTAKGATACTIDLAHCFPPRFGLAEGVRSEEVLKRVAFEKPECGDCIIVALVGKSGPRGLSAFLPSAPARGDGPVTDPDPEPLGGYATTWESADYSASLARLLSRRKSDGGPRRLALSRLARYAYVLGDTRTQFLSVRYEFQVRAPLQRLADGKDPTALLAINDDAGTNALMLAKIADALKAFFTAKWPSESTRASWEATAA